MPRRLLLLLSIAVLAPLRADEPQVAEAKSDVGQQELAPSGPPVRSMLELQVELHRRAFSCGSIDGVWGAQTESALRAFQRASGIAESGILDAPTQEKLRLTAPVLTDYTFTAIDIAGLKPIPGTWLEKSQMTDLGFVSAIELAGERFHANPSLLRRLNPSVDWSKVMLGTSIKVPGVERVTVSGSPERVVITLDARELDVVDSVSRVIAHFPVSIGRMVEKRPLGDLVVTVIIPDPNYTFDPAVFPESAEGKALGHNLTIPAGPNNPVGVTWIGLDRPGYGIHGTPEPENVGRTESHGCFRLANWDVLTLAGLVHVGMTVNVEQ